MEEHIVLLARHLSREQFEVFAITPDWEATKPFTASLQAAADHVTEITPDRRYGIWRQLREVLRMWVQIRRWRIEVMHMHSTTYRGQMVALLVARLAGVKRIYVTEHLAPDAPLPLVGRLIRDLFSKMLDGVVCVSQKNYRARSTYLFTPHARTLVVENGVDPNDFPPIPQPVLDTLRQEYCLPADAQVIGTVVRFEPEKGLDDLLAAFPAIRAACPRAYLLMVGDGSLRQHLEQQAQALGVAEYVRFTGFQRNPRPFLGLMDAFVLPVPVGSMSIGLLEAMAMGRAVVITFGGKGEAVVHGESGFCAEPHNPASIAQYVIEILSRPELQAQFHRAARERVEDVFSAQRVAKVLGELYVSKRDTSGG
ncbi:glycosyltransferase [Candidatus Oscillochloris fontis]|uniref:glycosyltransferase n=1 Tax=Candidatus Oscillochloris fontis TaxID=2496868 RepID=UPI0013764847|nr:glycosyltransferase [Candidatus Oscillochloris fontis]